MTLSLKNKPFHHYNVTNNTDLKEGDFVLINNEFAEIYRITVDDGIFTSRGIICRSTLENTEYQPDYQI